MKVNNLSRVNFASRVKIIENYNQTPEEIIGSKDATTLKRALHKLQQNEIDDTVKIFLLNGAESAQIGVKVEKNIGNKKYEGKSTIPLFYTDLIAEKIFEAYTKASEEANKNKKMVRKSRLDEFI